MGLGDYQVFDKMDMDNIIPALNHADRVCDITMDKVSSSNLEVLLPVMPQPLLSPEHLAA